MKPLLEHLPTEGEESFFAKAFDLPYFATPWHYHPEFELVLVVKSRGKRFIGNYVSDFQDGDLTLLGPNLPHLYRNPPAYYAQNPALRAQSIVIHFRKESIGQDFLALPQARKLHGLFERSRQGMDVLAETRRVVSRKMRELLRTQGMERLIRLLDILNVLADTTDYALISDPGIVGHNPVDTDRLDAVFGYILQNFNREIRLEAVADLVHMTRTSFCRFFKERTKRNFSGFLADVRLDHAAKLLAEGNGSIVQVSYACGYNNLSNFNRQFKEKHGVSPREYRHAYAASLK